MTKANVNLDKENKRTLQSFNQSLFEKEQLRKRIIAHEESMNEVIKENSILNEDIKVKSNLIKLLRVSILDENVPQVDK